MPKKYHGEGRGQPMEALRAALNEAWDKAKADGKQGKELRVDEWRVRGTNPLNWTGIVLVDDDDT
jgi:hypothetical protein